MYIPFNPDKDYGYWTKLFNSLSSNSFYPHITNGEHFIAEKNWMNKRADIINNIVKRMKATNYSRIGTNKTVPVPVHFAINIDKNSKGKIIELISIDNSENTLVNDINLVIQFAFFENAQLENLTIPLVIQGLDCSDVDIIADLEKGVTHIKRKNCNES